MIGIGKEWIPAVKGAPPGISPLGKHQTAENQGTMTGKNRRQDEP